MRKNPVHHLSANEIRLLAYDLGVSESELLRSMDRLVKRGSTPKRAASKKSSRSSKVAKIANPGDRSMASLHRAIDRACRKADKCTTLRDIKAIRSELVSDVGGASSRAGKIAGAQFDQSVRAPKPARRTNKSASGSAHRDYTPKSLDIHRPARRALALACANGHNDDENGLLRLLDSVTRQIAGTADGRASLQSHVYASLEKLISEYNKCARDRFRGSLSASTREFIETTFIPDYTPTAPVKRGRVRLVR